MMVCELLRVRETLRYRDPEPRRRPAPRRPDPESEAWAAARVAELMTAGCAARMERPRGQAPVVVYTMRHAGTGGE